MMYNLVVDIGNSLSKVAVVTNGGDICEIIKFEAIFQSEISSIIKRYDKTELNKCIVSSVRDEDIVLKKYLSDVFDYFIWVDNLTSVPIKNCYATPHTLGSDRLMAAVGAMELYERSDILLIDLGSAITVDFISKNGEFLGGNISPGLNLRFKALNQFTKKLPLVECDDNVSLIGESTIQAIRNGVVNGITYEIEGYINSFKEKHPELVTIFTGGDAKYFGNRVKNTIFVNQNLLIKGLNKVLEYNYAHKN